MSERTNRHDIVLAYLASHGPATAKTIAAGTTIAYSSLTPLLRQLAEQALIVKTGDTWATTASAGQQAQPADAEPDTTDTPDIDAAEAASPAAGDQPDTQPDPRQQDPDPGTDADSDEPAPLDPAGADDQSTGAAAPDLPVEAVEPDTADSTPDPVQASSPGTSVHPAEFADASQPTPAGTDDTDDTDEQIDADSEPGKATVKRRYNRSDVPALAKGQLREAVEAYLHSVPDQQLTIPQITAGVGQQLGRTVGNGAVQNAVLKLINLGKAVHLPGKPNKYQAATN